MEKFLTPNGYILSVSREEGVYFWGWITLDHEEGQALEKISTRLPDDTPVPASGKVEHHQQLRQDLIAHG